MSPYASWCLSIHPLVQTPNLLSSNLQCVVMLDVRVCGGGGCSYGFVVVAKCIGVSPGKY